MRAYNGTHALLASLINGEPALQRSCEACEIGAVQQLEDSDFEPLGDEDDLDEILAALQEIGGASEVPSTEQEAFIAFMQAVQAGDRDEALRLLHEHDERTGEFTPEQEDEVVDAAMNEASGG